MTDTMNEGRVWSTMLAVK